MKTKSGTHWLFIGKNDPIRLTCYETTIQVYVANELQFTKLENLLYYGYPKGSCFVVPEKINESGVFKKIKVKTMESRASEAIDFKRFFGAKNMGYVG